MNKLIEFFELTTLKLLKVNCEQFVLFIKNVQLCIQFLIKSELRNNVVLHIL